MQGLAAGDTLAGRYRLIRPLGEGATGRVWLAEDGAGDARVALKLADAATLAAQHEAGRRLVHPAIVRTLGLHAGPPPCLALQYCAGGHAGALRGAGFRAVVGALLPVAEALEYAHRQGVVHGDLKPSNVLRDEAARCLLGDFGAGGGALPGLSPQRLDGAPPVPADDVYGFGTLLYDLLCGAPPFHPGVSAERIRREVPALPAADLAGEALPPALARLLGSLLAKEPGARPPGMAAVRAALEEVLRESAAPAAVIRPRGRGADGAGGAPPVAPPRSGGALPARAVFAGLAGLAALALVVVLVLPGVVRERGPLVAADRAAPVAAAAPAAAPGAAPGAAQPEAAPAVSQAELDAALGEFLARDEALGKLNAQAWAGADWTELRRLAQAGDDAYRRREAATALASYRAAAALAARLEARAPGLLAESLAAGDAALAAGDGAGATRAFETALAIAPGEARARRGLARAASLDRVLELSARAAAAEAAGDRAGALAGYREAAALDGEWQPARAGIARLQAAAARDAFESQMARGYAAQAAGDLDAARAAFAAALRASPGDAQAQGALAQVDADRGLARLAALQAEARALEAGERWEEARHKHEAALALDSNLADSKAGRERAAARAELDARLRREIAGADRFNDDAAFARARGALEAGRAVADPGPVLRGQLAELERLLAIAATPVTVALESDNLTEVTVFKVGRLGAFDRRTLELRPGVYTAVGVRPGYRDVRRNFRVAPGAGQPPVVVRCEEPI